MALVSCRYYIILLVDLMCSWFPFHLIFAQCKWSWLFFYTINSVRLSVILRCTEVQEVNCGQKAINSNKYDTFIMNIWNVRQPRNDLISLFDKAQVTIGPKHSVINRDDRTMNKNVTPILLHSTIYQPIIAYKTWKKSIRNCHWFEKIIAWKNLCYFLCFRHCKCRTESQLISACHLAIDCTFTWAFMSLRLFLSLFFWWNIDSVEKIADFVKSITNSCAIQKVLYL